MRRSVEKTLGRVSDCLCKGFPLTRTKPRSYISQGSTLGCKHENCKQREEVTTDHKGLVSRTATKMWIYKRLNIKKLSIFHLYISVFSFIHLATSYRPSNSYLGPQAPHLIYIFVNKNMSAKGFNLERKS